MYQRHHPPARVARRRLWYTSLERFGMSRRLLRRTLARLAVARRQVQRACQPVRHQCRQAATTAGWIGLAVAGVSQLVTTLLLADLFPNGFGPRERQQWRDGVGVCENALKWAGRALGFVLVGLPVTGLLAVGRGAQSVTLGLGRRLAARRREPAALPVAIPVYPEAIPVREPLPEAIPVRLLPLLPAPTQEEPPPANGTFTRQPIRPTRRPVTVPPAPVAAVTTAAFAS